MKKLFIIFNLFGMLGVCVPAFAATVTGKTELRQADHKRKDAKKRSHIVKHRVSASRRQRMNMQLKQANKHLKEEQRAERAKKEMKKELQRSN